jgi:predicted nucleic acid-binding protein
MTAQCFIDTNILIYAGSAHPDDASKRAIALGILSQRDVGFSAQVMQEYYDVAYRKGRLAISREEALTALRAVALRPVVPITADLVLRAAVVSDRFKITYWDAAIVVAALELGCHTLYSEDLSHQQSYDGLTVVNPFI